MFEDISRNVWQHSPKCLGKFPGMFGDIPWNVWRHSPEYLRTFPGMFGDIPRNVSGHSPEFLRTFLGMFGNIPRNVWGNSPKCLATFPGIFEDIPGNVWRHSPEYNISPIRRVPPIPFPVPVFLVLYIASIILSQSLFEIFLIMRLRNDVSFLYKMCFLSTIRSKQTFITNVYVNFYFFIFFSIGVFFHNHSRFTGLQGKGEGISLTPHYHFHPLHRHFSISNNLYL